MKPLEDVWREILDAVLSARRAPLLADVARMAPRLAELSRAYNADGTGSRPSGPLDARIAFSFARDVPKGTAAVRELVASKALGLGDRPLRVLDLGAGLGAMTWGVARALEAAGARGRIDATLVDDDADALAAAGFIAREAESRLGAARPVELRIATSRGRLGDALRLPESDLVILGQVLSELDLGLDPEARVERHAALVRSLLRFVADDGALVVVEPALRERSRHLHAVRDRLLEGARVTGAAGVTLFAPCLHARPCPALAAPGGAEWCHEDLAVDLPAWLVPLARAAGLRWQGLTFSYLVLRRDGRTLAAELPPPSPERLRLRVVSDRIVTKGKTELFACTEAGERLRLRRLDRDAAEDEEKPRRGDVVALTTRTTRTTRTTPTMGNGGSPIDERGRIAANVAIDVWSGRK